MGKLIKTRGEMLLQLPMGYFFNFLLFPFFISIHSSVGEVRSGPVFAHFRQTADRMVWSLAKNSGPRPRLTETVYVGLVPVQTPSRPLLILILIFHFFFKFYADRGGRH